MFFQIEPIQLSIVRTCNGINIQVLELSTERIFLRMEFMFHQQAIYSCEIDLLPDEIQSFYDNKLDLFEWLFVRFNVKMSLSKKLKRKDLEEIQISEINKKIKSD